MLELIDVSFRYEGTAGTEPSDSVLHGIHLKVLPGEVVVLCGESGCGKSTVTRLINGLIPHYYAGTMTGSVLVHGEPVNELPLYETARMVGSVFQNPRSQFFNVDTTSELAFGCENQGLPEEHIRRRVSDTAGALGIDGLLNRNIFHLSGGEKQKIACASVSICQPDVLVLDEPSSNLDPAAIESLAMMIGSWKKSGKAVVVAEHRLYYLRSLADRILYMKDGAIREAFTPDGLAALPRATREGMGLRTMDIASLTLPHKDDLSEATAKRGALSLSNMRFSYPGKKNAIDIADLVIPAGSVVAVIGPNGAGKTTLARCLCGIERHCSGTLSAGGRSHRCKDLIAKSFMVMQDVNHQLFTESVLDEVLLSMRKILSEAERVKRAEGILESLDLLDLRDMHPMALSGGQKQRVAIASALASDKDIILFDEPTSGLDLRHMKEVSYNVHALKAMGKSIFMITHDLELVLECCDHIIFVHGGRVTESASIDESLRGRLMEFFEPKPPVDRRRELNRLSPARFHTLDTANPLPDGGQLPFGGAVNARDDHSLPG